MEGSNRLQIKNTAHLHYLQPDYTRRVYKIPDTLQDRIKEKLDQLYGSECSADCFRELIRIMQVYHAHKTPELIAWEEQLKPADRFSERDIILITYGDLIRKKGEKPLKTIRRFCKKYLQGIINTVHLLPFFPYSSDRGFAVMDFEEVDPQLGSWDDIADLGNDFKLMFDGVFNHVSSKSRWFQEFLNQNPYYKDFFTVFSTRNEISPDHLKLVVRPRTGDILSSFPTLNGIRLVWTTFSPDQIDLNYKNPKVLLKMVEILLNYVRHGAGIVRLDAVTYLWEELGTTCAHLEQTHLTIKLFRDILDAVAPHVLLITETNVPHHDNIKYFGNGRDEAQMVYNFALPPLVLYTFQNEDSSVLSQWARSLAPVSDEASYFNFLDSHDGIGVMAVKEILSKEEIEQMALKILEHGGYISYKDDGNGTVSPYEFNITWFSAINNEDADESVKLQVDRYIASRVIALILMGVPGIYLHGLFGSRNDAELVVEEKQTRSINRRTINEEELDEALNDPSSITRRVMKRLVPIIQKRIKQKAFHPNAEQRVFNLNPSLFVVLRVSPDRSEKILAIVNISCEEQASDMDLDEDLSDFKYCFDIISDQGVQAENGRLTLSLKPYEVRWLKA